MKSRKQVPERRGEETDNNNNSNYDDSEDESIQESQQNELKSPSTPLSRSTGRAKLRTNKNGLPIEAQRAILWNVIYFQGFDNFGRETCDLNPLLFGERNSARRIACRAKRRHFLEIHKNHPEEFAKLCLHFNFHPKGALEFQSPPVQVPDAQSASKTASTNTWLCASQTKVGSIRAICTAI